MITKAELKKRKSDNIGKLHILDVGVITIKLIGESYYDSLLEYGIIIDNDDITTARGKITEWCQRNTIVSSDFVDDYLIEVFPNYREIKRQEIINNIIN